MYDIIMSSQNSVPLHWGAYYKVDQTYVKMYRLFNVIDFLFNVCLIVLLGTLIYKIFSIIRDKVRERRNYIENMDRRICALERFLDISNLSKMDEMDIVENKEETKSNDIELEETDTVENSEEVESNTNELEVIDEEEKTEE